MRLLLLISLFFTACASQTQSALLGAAVGGGVGGAIGQIDSRNFKGTATGLLVGASIGSLVGLLAGKDQEKKIPESKPVKPDDSEFPPLTKPKLRSMWVPDKIEGNKYIKGHFIYVIEDPGNWSMD
jgi:hypothetical protein